MSDFGKKRTYDSSSGFDNSIPAEGVEERKFFLIYEPVFKRNYRFAIRVPINKGPAKGSKKSRKSKKNAGQASPKAKKEEVSEPLVELVEDKITTTTINKQQQTINNISTLLTVHTPHNPLQEEATEGNFDDYEPLPEFGDADTPISEVNAFYKYWSAFDSWRDFTLAASKIVGKDLDSAGDREEKRWMMKEVSTKMKKMKKEEVERVATLVERAMKADPRLKREKKR